MLYLHSVDLFLRGWEYNIACLLNFFKTEMYTFKLEIIQVLNLITILATKFVLYFKGGAACELKYITVASANVHIALAQEYCALKSFLGILEFFLAICL